MRAAQLTGKTLREMFGAEEGDGGYYGPSVPEIEERLRKQRMWKRIIRKLNKIVDENTEDEA